MSSEFNDTFNFFSYNCYSSKAIKTEADWKDYKKGAKYSDFLYLLKFTNDIYAWGTTNGKGSDRLRKTSLLTRKLTGKYDRRVDYLMLEILYGTPEILVFEMPGDARDIEQERRSQLNGAKTGPCIRGFVGNTRKSITAEIFKLFKECEHYLALDQNTKTLCDDFYDNYYTANLKYAGASGNSRSFAWGDCIEPNFLGAKLGRYDIESALEKALKVKF